MDELSEKRKNTEPGEVKPEAPKKKKKRFLSFLLWLIVLVLGVATILSQLFLTAFVGVSIYADRMLDLIDYEEPSKAVSWEGTNIDDPFYGFDDSEIPGGGGVSDWSNFEDPELSREDWSGIETSGSHGGSGGGGGGGGSTYEPYEPDYGMITGIFDDDIITEIEEKDVVNILLIGADTMNGKHARSDTMLLMSINNVKKRIVFTSLMRDTYVQIPGYKDNRLNAAFAAGGPNLLIKTIKHNFDITVDYYFMVSISSFEMAVDSIGGIDLTINEDNYDYFKIYNKEIQKLSKEKATDGTHVVHLGGAQALGYARSRAFSNGDFTRTLHQRDLLTQFANNCKGKSLEDMHKLLKSVLPYVSTNMPKNTLKAMVWDVLRYLSYSISDARMPCPGSFRYANINGREVLEINFRKNVEYLKAKIYG